VRYQAVDRMNSFIKRQFPNLHASAREMAFKQITPPGLRALINGSKNQLSRRPRVKRP
jgi:hypothetical protein